MPENESNDSASARRPIRDGFLKLRAGPGFEALATEEAMNRLFTARNSASKSANLFMLLAALIAGLYFLRLEGLAGEIKIGEYDLSKLPFGAFVLCSAALVMSCVSLVRAGDSRSYDRLLRLACEQRFSSNDAFGYALYPNEHAWGEPLSKMVFAAEVGRLAAFARDISVIFLNLFIILLIIIPMVAGTDFICNDRVYLDSPYKDLRFYFVIFLLSANVMTFYLIFWARIIDRD